MADLVRITYMKDPVFVRSCPIALVYCQYLMAFELGWLVAQVGLSLLFGDAIHAGLRLLLVFLLAYPLRLLVLPLFRLVGADYFPPECPVCVKRGRHLPRAWMAAFGEPDRPEKWRRLFFCPTLRPVQRT